MAGRDFKITAKFDDIDVPGLSDQLLLYVGTSADKVVRGGFHENQTLDPSGGTGQFILVGNTGATGFGFPQGDELGTFEIGDDITLSLSRTGGLWSMEWQNLSNPSGSGGVSGISIPWLDAESDLYVGLMHLDARNFESQTAKIDYFQVELGGLVPIPEPSSLALFALAGVALRPRKRSGVDT